MGHGRLNTSSLPQSRSGDNNAATSAGSTHIESACQGLPLEHLLGVPADVRSGRKRSSRSGPEALTVQVVDGSTLRRPRREAAGNDGGEVLAQPEHAAVEQLVVQGA